MRREADRLAADGRGDRFRRRRLEHNKDAEGLVLTAVTRAKQGDADAIRFLYLRYADNVYGYVCSIVRDEHEAEDVTQQIFAKLLTALQRYEPRAVPFSAWILRIAHNAAIDHMRARRAVPCEEVRSPDLEDVDVSRERARDLQTALEKLPPEQRDVIVMRFVLGLSPREIAERIGRSEDAVHGLQHRGRITLRKELTALQSAPAARHIAVAS
ncbi:MAG TPA: RNA polymerase sigma factor [Solirubrobacteraceae bacterium]|nr:RNA polymerase sigma factor [Solirubrobacteraceae bacterium]